MTRVLPIIAGAKPAPPVPQGATSASRLRFALGLIVGGTLGVACALDATVARADGPHFRSSWTGLYIGIHAGHAASSDSMNVKPQLIGDGTATPDLSGFTGGMQLGYNWQRGTMVVGLETDISGMAAKGLDSSTAKVAGLPFETRVQRSLDWLSTVRARIGFLPMQDLLLFATGGVAFGRVEQSLTFANLDPVSDVVIGLAQVTCKAASICTAGSSSSTSVGWTAGAGFEYAIAPQVSLKGEYLLVDLGNQSVTARELAGTQTNTQRASGDLDVHIVRAGINVRF